MRTLIILLTLLVLTVLAILWKLIPHEDDAAARLTRHAGFDLVTACNEAAEAEGAPERFTAADAHPISDLHEGPGHVAVLVSALEARHGGLACRWDGIDPPSLTRDQ
jgi:hypothetical protein